MDTTVLKSHLSKSRISKSRPSKSRSKSGRNSKGRCMRPGPISRNPYLNFLREFRRKCCGMSPVKTVVQGAKAWNALNKAEKLRYIEEAFYAPRRRRHTMSKSMLSRKRLGRRSSSKRRSRSRKSRSMLNRKRVSRRSSAKRRSMSRKSTHSSASKNLCNL